MTEVMTVTHKPRRTRLPICTVRGWASKPNTRHVVINPTANISTPTIANHNPQARQKHSCLSVLHLLEHPHVHSPASAGPAYATSNTTPAKRAPSTATVRSVESRALAAAFFSCKRVRHLGAARWATVWFQRNVRGVLMAHTEVSCIADSPQAAAVLELRGAAGWMEKGS